jgi:serine acetyltransferase
MRAGGRIAANATVLPGQTIEADGLVAASAVVTRDVPAHTVVVGIPAREYGPVPEEQLLENQVDGKTSGSALHRPAPPRLVAYVRDGMGKSKVA